MVLGNKLTFLFLIIIVTDEFEKGGSEYIQYYIEKKLILSMLNQKYMD